MAYPSKNTAFKDNDDEDNGLDPIPPTLWKMPKGSSSLPVISINEKELHSDDLDSIIEPNWQPSKLSVDTGPTTSLTEPSVLDNSSSVDDFLQERVFRGSNNVNEFIAAPGIYLKLWRRKLMVLIWANFVMRYRKQFVTFVELIFPAISLAFLLVGLTYDNSGGNPEATNDNDSSVSNESAFYPTNIMSKETLFKYVCSNEDICDAITERRNFFIVYSPNIPFVDRIMEDVRKLLSLGPDNDHSQILGVSSPLDVEKQCKSRWEKEDKLTRYPYGIIFSFHDYPRLEELLVGKTVLVPPKLEYTIRTFYPEISNTAENVQFVEHGNGLSSRHDVSPYIFTGFAGLQMAIDLAYAGIVVDHVGATTNLQTLNQKAEDLFKYYRKSINVRMFEYPVFLEEDVRDRIWTGVVLSFIYGYILSNFCVVEGICLEAKMGNIELLKFHGLTPSIHWISFGLNTAFLKFFTSCLLALTVHLCFSSNGQLPYPHFLTLWLFLFLHGMAQSCEICFLAHWFSSPTRGGKAAVFYSLASFLIPKRLLTRKIINRPVNILLTLLFPQWCLANGLYTYLQYQLYEDQVDYYDFPVLLDAEQYVIVPLQICCITFFGSIAIYSLLTIYIDQVVSRTFSPGMSWISCLLKYYGPKPENQKPVPPINYAEMPNVFEKPSPDLVCTVRVRNLCKSFETSKSYEISLDDINLDIYEGEITAIVGQAGSGKTNLIHLIGGLIKPTSGYVEMKNLKVHDHSYFLSQFISICPQNSMLFSTLSVEDHVRLCCMVYGFSYRKSKTQARLLMQLFNLTGWKMHNYYGLSESNKKNLAMAMALASHPTILLLDEPCQGMDFEASKLFWRYLQVLKMKRTIIIATSSMAGVELYCDRMALMAKGKLFSYGTPSRINKYYDIGLVLNLNEDEVEIDLREVEKIIMSEVKTVTSLSPLGYEPLQMVHRFLLPYGKAYAALLENLEDNMMDLGFSKLWLTRAEIGTIFYKMSLGKDVDSVLAARETTFFESSKRGSIGMKSFTQDDVPPFEAQIASALDQFSALFTKKWNFMFQKHHFLVTEFLISMMLMVLATVYAKDFLHFVPESLDRPLHIKTYQNTSTLFKTPNDAWFHAFRNVSGGVRTTRLLLEEVNSVINKRRAHTLTNFHQQTIIAIEQTDNTLIGHYSRNSYHSCPIALNALVNSMLYILSPNKTIPYQIRVGNYPIPKYQGYSAGSSQNYSTTMYGILISIILALIAVAELHLPTLEKRYELKNTILMTGVHPSLYWITTACGDIFKNSLATVALMGILCIFDMMDHQITGKHNRLILALIFFGYLCWTSPPFSYMLSFMIKTQSYGYSHYLLVHFCFGIFPKVMTYQIFHLTVHDFSYYVRYILYILPPYSLVSALVNYFHIVAERNLCESEGWENYCEIYSKLNNRTQVQVSDEVKKNLNEKSNYDPLFRSCCRSFCEPQGICYEAEDFFVDAPTPGFKDDMLAMALQGLFYWILVIVTEHHIPQNIFFFFYSKLFGDKESKASIGDHRDADEPEDVKKEHVKVDYLIDIEDNVDSEVFLVQNVTKFYNTNKCIDHAYFSIPCNYTTAILGLSKSGMTTVLKLLINQFSPTSGYIYMNNELMTSKNKTSCTVKMGYCPQNSHIYPELTGFQVLQMMGKLRGIPKLEVDLHVRRWLDLFGLTADAHLKCKTYRPGVLRRICCALAMIGAPKIAIFDQPTVGMDFQERHIFWKALTMAKERGQTTIFSSSETDEVKMCSNKALLLDSGAIVAVGTLQDIFKTNDRGFILSVKCRMQAFKKLSGFQIASRIDELRDHIINHLSPCELLLDDGNILVYHLKDLTTKLSYAYGIMEGARENFPKLLDNFLVAESSLDAVVLNFHKISQAKEKKKTKSLSTDQPNDDKSNDNQQPRRSNSV